MHAYGNTGSNKRIGVVFSSGFFGFFAHAGCLKALEELGIRADGYAGSSAGAVVAAFAASGMDVRTLCNLILNLEKKDLWDPEPWYVTAASALKLFRGWRGRIAGNKIKRLINNNIGAKSIEELEKPCVIAATNISEKSSHAFISGSIADAVLSSCAVPWLFRIQKINHSFFLDGGFVEKAPLEPLAARIDRCEQTSF